MLYYGYITLMDERQSVTYVEKGRTHYDTRFKFYENSGKKHIKHIT